MMVALAGHKCHYRLSCQPAFQMLPIVAENEGLLSGNSFDPSSWSKLFWIMTYSVFPSWNIYYKIPRKTQFQLSGNSRSPKMQGKYLWGLGPSNLQHSYASDVSSPQLSGSICFQNTAGKWTCVENAIEISMVFFLCLGRNFTFAIPQFGNRNRNLLSSV